MERIDFLWLVRTERVLPAARSHSRTVESMLPVITWGVAACVTIDATVLVCPPSTWMLFLVRMSHTCAPYTERERERCRDVQT
jgi:hypothetical protein